MSVSRIDRFLPLSGVLAGLLFVAVMVLTNGSPDEADAAALTTWTQAHQGAAQVAGFAQALLAVAMAFFAVALRLALRSGEPGESTYSSVAFAGGLMVAAASAAWSVVTLATTSAIDDGDDAAVPALAHLGSVSWLPWLAGSAVLFLGTGIGAYRTATMPRWLAVTTLVLGGLCLTGVGGFVVYLASPVWLAVAGVVLHRRLPAAMPGGRPVTSDPVRA